MSGNNKYNNDTEDRCPDNIVKMTLGGLTYEIYEYCEGTRTLTEIITQRIIKDMQIDGKACANPTISTPQNANKG